MHIGNIQRKLEYWSYYIINGDLISLANELSSKLCGKVILRKDRVLHRKICNTPLLFFIRRGTTDFWFANPAYEKLVTLTMAELMPSASVFLDIGANIGRYSLMYSSLNKNGKLIAFEPVRDNFRILLINLVLNDLFREASTLLYNKACWSERMTLQFVVNRINTGASRHNISDGEGIELIEAETLDNVFNALKIRLNEETVLVKMDVEGGEIEVLKGAEILLGLPNVTIVAEFHGGYSILEKELKKHGFRHIRAVDNCNLIAQKL